MKPALFRYYDPASLDDALGLMAEWGDEAKILAGGQTLGPMLNFRVLAPAAIIDINQVRELEFCRDEGEETAIGGLTRQARLEDDTTLAARQPLVAEAIPFIAHRAIRNRGSVGGSLAHADPAAEWGALAMTLDARLRLRRQGGGDRTLAAADYFRGMLETALAPDELLAEIRLPCWPAGAGWSFQEFARRHGDFALAGIACLVALDRDGACSEARFTAFGVEPTPKRLRETEILARGERPSAAATQALARRAAREVEPMSDRHASADYRRHLVEVLVERALDEALTRVQHSLH